MALLRDDSTKGATSEPISDHIDLERLYFLLLRKLWLILTITCVVCLATWAWLARQPKLYTAKAVIQIEQGEQKVVNMDDVSATDPTSKDFIATVIQAMTSRPVLVRVIKSLDLTNDPTFAPPLPDGKKYTPEQLSTFLSDRIEISPRKSTRLVDIQVDDTDPVRAQKIASALVKEFFRESFEQRLAFSRVANDFLKDEAAKLKTKLEESERKIQDYREKNQAVSLEDRQNIIVEKLRELNTKVTDAKSTRLRLESDIEQIRNANPKNTDEMLRIGSVNALPQVAAIRDQLSVAQTELATIQERYLSKHPKYISAATRIANLKESLRDAAGKAGEILSREYDASKDNEAKLEQALKDQEQSSLELSSIAIPYNVLQREVDSDRALYDAVVKRLKETAVMQGVEQVPFQVIEEPLAPSKPSKPRILLILAFVGFATFVITVIVIVGRDGFDTSLKTVDEAETYLGVPTLTAVPDLQSKKKEVLKAVGQAWQKKERPDLKRIAKKVGEQSEGHPLVMVDDPSSPAAEAFRSLRAAIAFLGKKEDHRSFLFCSAIPSEGKTFSSLNCAIAFAQQGLRTVIIDADLRKPKIHNDLLPGKKDLRGLTDYLSEQAKLTEVFHDTKIENLTVIPAGSRCPNPSELLSKADLAGLAKTLLERYDRVIFDTAPVNAVSDTLPLCHCVQSVILVARAGKTPRKAIQRALAQLRKANGNVVGIVLNRLPSGRGAGYYYYYYGDKYAEDSVYGAAST